jgi:hypothetical protein
MTEANSKYQKPQRKTPKQGTHKTPRKGKTMKNKSIKSQFAALSIEKQSSTLAELKSLFDARISELSSSFTAAVTAEPVAAPAKKVGRPAGSKSKPKVEGEATVPAKKLGRKPSENSLGNFIAKELANAPAEGLKIEDIAKAVRAAGYETKSDEDGFTNQVRGAVSKLNKAGRVTPVTRGHYTLSETPAATSEAPAEEPAEAPAA